MKKLFILSFILALSVGLMAQRSSTSVTAKALPASGSTATVTLIAVDSVSNTSVGTWIFDINKVKSQYFALSVKLAPLATTAKAHAYVNVLGSIDKVTWVATTATQVKYGGGADSTMVLYDVATGVMWRYLEVVITGKKAAGGRTSFGTSVKAINLKVGDK